MLEDGGLSDNVSGNDGDVDNANSQLLWSLLNGGTAAANGQLFFNPNGGFTFIPDLDHVGPVAFSYRVCDPSGACADATVSIDVTGVNDAPVAADDNTSTGEETSVDIAVTGNDTDSDGNVDVGTVSILFPPGNGTVSIGIGGVVSYNPNLDFVGMDQFTYQVCDDGTPLPNACDNATVTIEVLNVNDAPIATGEAYFTDEDGFSITSNVGVNDFDTDNAAGQRTYTLFDCLDAALPGSLTVDADGTIAYDPADDFNGNVSFIYQVCDPGGLCDLASVLLFILPVNDPIIVLDDQENTAVDLPVTNNVIANDSDPNDPAGGVNAQSVVIIAGPFNGLATANANGTITYEPGPGYSGLDSLQYTVCDLGDAVPVSCDTAWLVILVDNTYPQAVDDSYMIEEDTDSSMVVLSNDLAPTGVLVPSTVIVLDPRRTAARQ
ncbi:MAG: tandem-95 repeat protein [Flavobacteriales bacterium]|nr:tandem-95 repeat protein [Flavobacteriales bacterium]